MSEKPQWAATRFEIHEVCLDGYVSFERDREEWVAWAGRNGNRYVFRGRHATAGEAQAAVENAR